MGHQTPPVLLEAPGQGWTAGIGELPLLMQLELAIFRLLLAGGSGKSSPWQGYHYLWLILESKQNDLTENKDEDLPKIKELVKMTDDNIMEVAEVAAAVAD